MDQARVARAAGGARVVGGGWRVRGELHMGLWRWGWLSGGVCGCGVVGGCESLTGS